MPDDLVLMQRHQFHHPLIFRHQSLAPDLGRLKRHLQHLPGHGRVVVKRGDALDVGFAEAFEVNGGVVLRHEISLLDQCVAGHFKPLLHGLATTV